MIQASTLKVREYLMWGLPVYAGYVDVFPENFPFFRSGECDIEAMIEFGLRTKLSSSEEVRRLSKPYIDKSILLKELYCWLTARFA